LGQWTYELEHTRTKKKIERNYYHLKRMTEQILQEQREERDQQQNVKSSTINEWRNKTRRKVLPPCRYGFERGGCVAI
jgi:hypothetical protein